MSFIHLHTHSEFSWLDGACYTDRLVETAKRHKMPAVAVTDRNSVAGALRLSLNCARAGIKPIIGLEIEVLNDAGDQRAFSVILLAKNLEGYGNLCRLVTLAHEQDPSAPRISKSILREHSGGLICLSFSVVGELCTLLLEERDEEARRVSDWYRNLFGEDYYYEIQNHGLPREAIAMNRLLNLDYRTKIPVVLTNDCHYLQPQDSITIDALNCLRRGIDFSHPEAKRFACNQYWLKPPREMKRLFDFPPQLIKNSLRIADKIELDLPRELRAHDTQAPTELEVLRSFESRLEIGGQPRADYSRGPRAEELAKQLLAKLPEHRLVPVWHYQAWTPAQLYAAVLKVFKVPKARIAQLCKLIPPEAESLLEAILLSTEFSCLSAQDYVCNQAFEIADKLLRTYKDASVSESSYVIVPKSLDLPMAMDGSGKLGCQFSKEDMRDAGLTGFEFLQG